MKSNIYLSLLTKYQYFYHIDSLTASSSYVLSDLDRVEYNFLFRLPV